MSKLHHLKQWAKHSPGPLASLIRTVHGARRALEVPRALIFLYVPIFNLHRLVGNVLTWISETLYWTPLFKSQISGPAKRLNLFGGLPFVSGPLEISCGNDCRISGATTFSGRNSPHHTPRLEIGNNVGIGWQTTIAVGTRVILKDNVRMGGRNFLAGYPGHPVNAKDRAAGLPDHEDQIGDIILEKDVWIGTGAMIMAGVTIGEGTIVAAGSIVTKSLPPNVLAGGAPARVLKSLHHPELELVK